MNDTQMISAIPTQRSRCNLEASTPEVWRPGSEIVWNPSEDERGPYLSMRTGRPSRRKKSRVLRDGVPRDGDRRARRSQRRRPHFFQGGEFRKNFRFEDGPGPGAQCRLSDMAAMEWKWKVCTQFNYGHVYG